MSDDRGRQIAAGAQIYKCEQQSGDTLFDLTCHSLIPVGKPERCVDSEHAANPGEPRAIAQIRDTVHQVAAVHKLLSEVPRPRVFLDTELVKSSEKSHGGVCEQRERTSFGSPAGSP